MPDKHARPTTADNPPPYRSAGTKKSTGPLKSAFRRVKAIFRRSNSNKRLAERAATTGRLEAELRRNEIAKESHRALLMIHYAHVEALEAEKRSVQASRKSREDQGTLTAVKEDDYNARIRYVEARIEHEKIRKIDLQDKYEAADAAVQRLMIALHIV